MQHKPHRELSKEEKQMILISEDFQSFFHQSSRIIERALSEHVDIFRDYSGASETDNNVYAITFFVKKIYGTIVCKYLY